MISLKRNDRNKTKGEFQRSLLISFASLVVLSLVVVIFFLTISFESLLQKKAARLEQTGIERSASVLSLISELSRITVLQVYYDPLVSRLRLFKEINPGDLNESLDRLDLFASLSDFAQSLYIYNNLNNKVFHGGYSHQERYTSLDKFPDSYLKSIISGDASDPVLTMIPRRIPIPYEGNQTDRLYINGYSFIFHESPGKDSKIDNLVMVNISETWLKDAIRQIDTDRENMTHIIDSRGRCLLSTVNFPLFMEMSEINYVKKIINNENDEGYFIELVDGIKSLVVFEHKYEYDWIFIRVVPYEEIGWELKKYRINSLIIGSIILFGTLMGVFFQARRIGSPVTKAMKRLNQLDHDWKNSLITLKLEYLKNLILKDQYNSCQEIIRNFGKYEISLLPDKPVYPLLFLVDNGRTFFDIHNADNSIQLIREYLLNQSIRVFNTQLIEVVSLEPGKFLCILQTENHQFKPEIINEEWTSLLKPGKKNLPESFTLVLPSGKFPLHEIHRSWEELCINAECRLYRGHGSIIGSEDERELQSSSCIYIPVDKLIGFISEGNKKALELLEEILNDLKQYKPSQYRSTSANIIICIQNAVDLIKRNIGLSINYFTGTYIQKIYDEETNNQIRDLIINITERILTEVNTYRNNHHFRLIKIIQDKIMTQYGDTNMSLQLLSDSVHLSSSYLGRIFKQYTGLSIVDYINITRIEKGRILLEQRKLTVSEIAQKTGFTNSQYFHRLFKRYNHCTPKEYREKIEKRAGRTETIPEGT